MRKILRRSGLALLVVLLAAQAVPVERENPPVTSEIVVPAEVRAILERSCYDCHSNRTRWPWYSRIAPVSWYVTRHVNRARADLNLTEWPLLELDTQRYLLGEMKGKVKNREMPLDSYTWLHRGARLSDEERLALITWFDQEALLLRGF